MINLLALNLFGRHVSRSSNDHARLRERGVANSCNAEIQHLNRALIGKHEVGGLQVAVDDSFLMRKAHGAADLLCIRNQSWKRGKRTVIQQRQQSLSFNKLHAEIN